MDTREMEARMQKRLADLGLAGPMTEEEEEMRFNEPERQQYLVFPMDELCRLTEAEQGFLSAISKAMAAMRENHGQPEHEYDVRVVGKGQAEQGERPEEFRDYRQGFIDATMTYRDVLHRLIQTGFGPEVPFTEVEMIKANFGAAVMVINKLASVK